MSYPSGTRRIAILSAVALVAGLVGYATGTISTDPSVEPPPASREPGSAAVLTRIDALEEELRAERERNGELRSDIEWMATRLEATAAGVETLLEADTAQGPSEARTAAAVGDPHDGVARTEAEETNGEGPDDIMVRAGFDAAEIESYRARVGEIEMARLYLADQAAREGWMGTDRFRGENLALGAELDAVREDFGDDLYDWALYSAGRPNRVQVASVIAGSPAAMSGIEPGDIITGYGRDRILLATDLQRSTRRGSIGETTRVELVRGGETLRVSVPRGPMGVRLRPSRQRPSPVGRAR